MVSSKSKKKYHLKMFNNSYRMEYKYGQFLKECKCFLGKRVMTPKNRGPRSLNYKLGYVGPVLTVSSTSIYLLNVFLLFAFLSQTMSMRWSILSWYQPHHESIDSTFGVFALLGSLNCIKLKGI